MAVSPCDENMPPRFKNNYHPLRFHQVHGDNIKLSKNGTVACRAEGFCKGIAFSDRPVTVCEPVYVKFLEISSNWSGALRIGFTMHDPMSMKSKLPRYACPDLTSTHGNWAKAIAERMAKKDSVLYYYVDQNGDVHYGIDAEEHGIFFGGVNTSSKLWAVLDIYGNTVAVEFIDPSAMSRDCGSDSQNIVSTIKNKPFAKFPEDIKLSSLNFHRIHGKNVTLKRNGAVVSRKQGFNSLAYAFTERPIRIGEKVVLQVLHTDNFYSGTLLYGITSCDPSTLDPCNLPENTEDLLDRPEYWIVHQDSTEYRIGDIIIFSFNADGIMYVETIGKQRKASFHVDPTLPLWIFINIISNVSEVHLIGISSNSGNAEDLVKPFEYLTLKSEDGEAKPGPSSQQQTFSECVICYEESVDCVLYRCGHVCMCYKCARKMWQPKSNVRCPICREIIQDVIKIYR